MTPEEAIEALKLEGGIDITGKPKRISKFFEALDFAIGSLEEIQQYQAIGTVEECREAAERQTQKKCAIDSCPDHTHYKCPSCGQIELSIYKHGFPRLGRITKHCENCGQALQQEDI